MDDGNAFGGHLAPAPQGAMARPDYMERTSKVYAIYESEMDTIKGWNEISTVAYSLAGSLGGFALSIWVQNNMSPAATDTGKVIVALGIPGSIILGIACAIVGWRFGRKREGALNRIKSESRAVPTAGVP